MPVVIFYLWWLGIRSPAYRQRRSEFFGFSPTVSHDQAVIWIHAVSVGEVEACRPLVKALQADYSDAQILITTMTATGSARIKSVFSDTVIQCFVPYDLPFAIKRFLANTHPQMVVIMETEIWPNLISCCHQQAIPMVLANARLSARSAKGYARVARFSRSILQKITLIATQSADDKKRFQQLGVDPQQIHIMGTLKYEMTLPSNLPEQALAMRTQWDPSRPVLVAASTQEGEEEMVLDAASQIRTHFPTLLLIIVPRHPQRFDKVATLVQRSGVTVVRRSEGQTCSADIQVLVVDTMGELPLFYAASDIAFVGGSLVPHGGHNLLEPALLGCPVMTGPHFFNFSEITKQFLHAQAAIKVLNTKELAQTSISLLQNEQQRTDMSQAGSQLIAASQGASSRLVSLIKQHIMPHV